MHACQQQQSGQTSLAGLHLVQGRPDSCADLLPQLPHAGVRVCCPSLPLQRLSLGALLVVAAYDGWESRRLAQESSALAAKAKLLNSQLLQSE